MKLSQDTIEILKNFASINGNIKIEEGNVIKTMSVAETIVGYAEVDENFPAKANIYDLMKFLTALDKLGGDDPQIEFEDDKKILISNKSLKLKTHIWLCEDKMIRNKGKKVNFPDPDLEITLEADVIEKILKAAEALKMDSVSISSDGEKVQLVVDNIDYETSDGFKMELQDGDGSVFEFIFSTKDLLVLLPGTYDISLSSKKLGQFKRRSDGCSVTYWIAMNISSTFHPAETE